MECQPSGLSAEGGSDMQVRRNGAGAQWALPKGQATRRREVLQGLGVAAPRTPIKPRERNERPKAATIERPERRRAVGIACWLYDSYLYFTQQSILRHGASAVPPPFKKEAPGVAPRRPLLKGTGMERQPSGLSAEGGSDMKMGSETSGLWPRRLSDRGHLGVAQTDP